MACNICGQFFNNRFQLGPHRRVCVAPRKRRCICVLQGCSSGSDSENEPNVITTPVQVVRQTPEQVCLRACANRERGWETSTPALFVTRPSATSNSMARDYRQVSDHSAPSLCTALNFTHLLRTHVRGPADLSIACMIVFSCKICGKSMFSALTTHAHQHFGVSSMLCVVKR